MTETQTITRPKTYPISGDVLEKNGRRRYVVSCFGNVVVYHPGNPDKERECWISRWMEWARHAEVVALGTAE